MINYMKIHYKYFTFAFFCEFPQSYAWNNIKAALFVGPATNVLALRQTVFHRFCQSIRTRSRVLTLAATIGNGEQKVWIFAGPLDVVLVLWLGAGHHWRLSRNVPGRTFGVSCDARLTPAQETTARFLDLLVRLSEWFSCPYPPRQH
jgi:hypothetical protein